MIGLLGLPVLLAFAVAAACWPWTALHDRRPTVRLLTTLVATSAVVVVLEVGLGMAGALAGRPLAISACAAAALLVGSFLLLRARRPALALAPPWFPAIARPTPPGLLLGGLTAAAHLWLLFVGALVPPYGWDTLGYHLTDVFRLAQARSLAMVPDPSHSFFYPQAGELHGLWPYLLSGAGARSWRVVGLGLLPLSLTAGVAARAAAEALGARRGLPWIVPGVMLAPVVMIQPLAGYVDVAFAAFLLASYAYAILAAVEGRPRHVALACLAGGLALGVKISFLYFGLPVLLLLAAPRARAAIAGRTPLRTLARVLGLALLLALGGGYWYARNAIATGNPFYPHHVRLAGLTLFAGPTEIWRTAQQSWFVRSAWGWLFYPLRETFFGKPAYSVENGFGPQFAAGLVATVAGIALAARAGHGIRVRALLALPLTVLLWLAVNPTPEPRYAIACCGYALLALAIVAEHLGGERGEDARPEAGRPMRLVRAAMAAAVLFSALGGAASAVPDLGVVLNRWRAGTWTPEAIYPLVYGPAGRAFNWISENGAPGRTVTYTNANFVAPLYGWHDRNRVVYAATEERAPEGPYPRAATYEAWREFLRRERVDWIVVWIPWWGEKWPVRAEAWIGSHPADFAVVADFEGRARVYRPVFSGEPAPADGAAPPAVSPPGGR